MSYRRCRFDVEYPGFKGSFLPCLPHSWRARPRSGLLLSLALALTLAGSLSACVPLRAQRLRDEALGGLLGGTVHPQDRVLGPLYIPAEASRDSRQIFDLLRRFWNDINAGQLDDELLSADGQTQISEQVAPFIRQTPTLYRESLRAPQDQFARREAEAPQQSTTEDAGLPPTQELQLSRVRLADPAIEDAYARVRCRLEINDNSAFIQANIYILMEAGAWKVDALDIDWENIVAAGGDQPMNVFGRKIETYPQ